MKVASVTVRAMTHGLMARLREGTRNGSGVAGAVVVAVAKREHLNGKIETDWSRSVSDSVEMRPMRLFSEEEARWRSEQGGDNAAADY